MENTLQSVATAMLDEAPRPSRTGLKRILVADDDGEMRTLIYDLLRPLRAEILEASSGVGLLSCLRDRPRLDLVITDVRMPWMAGDRVVIMARAAGIAIPVLVTTAFADDELRREIARISHTRLLEKPFSAQALLREARYFLGVAAC